MQIKGYWYPANSAARYPATLNIQADQFSLVISDQDNLVGKVNTLSVSDRVGNITRKIGLYDQSIFETQANDQIDQLLLNLNHKDKKLHFLHHLETHWHWIATALLLTVVASFSTVYWGLPWASEKLAYSMPKVVSEKVSEGTLDILDKVLLEPSKLDKQQQASIRQHFEETLLSIQAKDNLDISQSANYQLKFRQLDDIPNALALPSGTIIITDALINMADNQAEIDSVLLHEIGHIESRHGLQQIIHSSIVTIGLAMMIGDTTAVEEMLIALPTLLLQSHYSRKHETEADNYAFEKMIQLNIDPIHFAHLFEKMLAWEEQDTATPSRPDEDEQDKANLLSTHPSSPERIQRAREYSKQYF